MLRFHKYNKMLLVLIELSRIEIEERQGDTRDEIQVLIELSRIEMKQCRKQQNFRHQY